VQAWDRHRRPAHSAVRESPLRMRLGLYWRVLAEASPSAPAAGWWSTAGRPRAGWSWCSSAWAERSPWRGC